jgi:hypothetical protein
MSTPTDGPAHGPDPHLENPDVRFERRDANIRLILFTAGGLVAVAVAVLLILWGMMDYYNAREAKTHRDGNPLAEEDSKRQLDERLRDIPAPSLEGLQPVQSEYPFTRSNPKLEVYSPRIENTDLRPTNYPQLTTYGPAEPARDGYVRIPIDRAMQLVLEKDLLKAREKKESVPEPSRGVLDRPTQANSGRGPQKREENE